MNNEELNSILTILTEKLSHLSKYEDILIKEADLLKNMYQKMYEHSANIEKLLKQFDSEKYVFFRDFKEKIRESIKESLSSTLDNKSISFTLIDIENPKDPIHEFLKERLEQIEINVINKLEYVEFKRNEVTKQGK